MKHLFIDLETYSDVDIGKAGSYAYAMSPSFEILLFGYSLNGSRPTVVDLASGEEIPAEIRTLLADPTCVKHAYNAPFEWFCLSRYLRLSDELTAAWASQWRCSMLHAMYAGYPAGLAATGPALGLPQDKQKLSIGSALISYFCKPCKPTKTNGGRTRNLPQHDPDKWELFKTYNAQDVEAEMAIDELLSSVQVPADVQRQWELDQRINLRGVAVDMDLANGAIELGEQVREQMETEAREISGLDNPNSVAQLKKWLEQETGEEIDSLNKQTVSDLLGRELSSDAAARILEIRRELGKTSTKKYNAIELCVCPDGRVRGLLQFYGANRTGREAGRLVQVQNLPHDVIPATSEARILVKDRNAAALQMLYGSIMQPLSALIRTAFVPKSSCKFVDADFSAIEARVIAWLAGEEWVLDVFRTHGKIYEATASQMFGIPLETIKRGHENYSYRAKGKVATLALGYQGGPGALIQMGALRSGLTEEELPDIVSRWRRSNAKIVQFWYDLQDAADRVVRSGASTAVGRVQISREMDARVGLDFMVITLPSGRKLYYPEPRIGRNRYGNESLVYSGQNQTTKKWTQLETYGGKLAENITQAVARDCLFYAMEQLEAAGYPIVFDVHDEVVIETEHPDLDDVVRIMSQPAPWASDLPLNAAGWVDEFYKKD